MPRGAAMMGECRRLAARGLRLQAQACYIRCSDECVARLQKRDEVDDAKLRKALDFEPLDFAAADAKAAEAVGMHEKRRKAARDEAVKAARACLADLLAEQGANDAGVYAVALSWKRRDGSGDHPRPSRAVRDLADRVAEATGGDAAVAAAAVVESLGAWVKGGLLKDTGEVKEKKGAKPTIGDEDPAALAKPRSYAANATLKKELDARLKALFDAREKAVAALKDRAAGDLCRKAMDAGSMLTRTPFDSYCPVGHPCTKSGHICSVFRTKDERDLALDVLASLVDDGLFAHAPRRRSPPSLGRPSPCRDPPSAELSALKPRNATRPASTAELSASPPPRRRDLPSHGIYHGISASPRRGGDATRPPTEYPLRGIISASSARPALPRNIPAGTARARTRRGARSRACR